MSRGTEELGIHPPLFFLFRKHLYGSHCISKVPAVVRGDAGVAGRAVFNVNGPWFLIVFDSCSERAGLHSLTSRGPCQPQRFCRSGRGTLPQLLEITTITILPPFPTGYVKTFSFSPGYSWSRRSSVGLSENWFHFFFWLVLVWRSCFSQNVAQVSCLSLIHI